MNRSRLAAICIGIAALIASITPGSALARQGARISRQAAAPVFSFPTNGTSHPSNGPYVFQLQPLNGAKGYLWSFVQNGMVVYQNLAWDGHLSPSNYTVATSSKAHRLIHPGDLHVWVRALMQNGQWSATGAVIVRIQGKGSHTTPPTPQPKPTTGPTHPAPGTVLYQADTSGGLDKWAGTSDWKHVDGMLVDDGSNRRGAIAAPYNTGNISDYAVEVQIQMVTKPCGQNFGIGVRESTDGTGGYTFEISSLTGLCHLFTTLGAGTSSLARNDNISLDKDWHTYRIEVKGNSIRALIDGAVVLTATDNHYLNGGGIGLNDGNTYAGGMQINVRSFKVIAL